MKISQLGITALLYMIAVTLESHADIILEKGNFDLYLPMSLISSTVFLILLYYVYTCGRKS